MSDGEGMSRASNLFRGPVPTDAEIVDFYVRGRTEVLEREAGYQTGPMDRLMFGVKAQDEFARWAQGKGITIEVLQIDEDEEQGTDGE